MITLLYRKSPAFALVDPRHLGREPPTSRLDIEAPEAVYLWLKNLYHRNGGHGDFYLVYVRLLHQDLVNLWESLVGAWPPKLDQLSCEEKIVFDFVDSAALLLKQGFHVAASAEVYNSES